MVFGGPVVVFGGLVVVSGGLVVDGGPRKKINPNYNVDEYRLQFLLHSLLCEFICFSRCTFNMITDTSNING